MTKKTIKTGPLYRSFKLDERAIDEETRTVKLSFSSEEPVERFFGKEILDHKPSSVRLGRLQGGGAVLVNHDTGHHVGVTENAEIQNNRGIATVKIGKTSRAGEVFTDLVDGILRHVSIGYRIHKAVLESTGDDGDTFRITDWEPFEISFVSVPADPTVGVGRSAENENDLSIETRDLPEKHEDIRMDPKDKNTPADPAPAVDVRKIEEETRKKEIERTRAIIAIGDMFEQVDMAREYVNEGKSVDEFNRALLEKMGTNRHKAVPDADIGLTEKEVKRYSVVRVINALANPSDRRAREAAAFEFECSEEAAQRSGVSGAGVRIPVDILRRPLMEKRDLNVGTTTAGGHTVSTDLLAQSFIDLLRNRMLVASRATMLSDLVGNIAIPRQTGGATAYWVAESGAPTESQQAFDQVTMSPNTVGAFTDFSRKLMLQSSLDVEAFVRRDLATIIALELDRVVINGSGASNEPEGILNTTGTGDVAGGTNGAEPTWNNIVDLESEVAIDNADIGDLWYVLNAVTRGKLKKTFVDTGSNAERVWDNRAGDTPLNGYGGLVTNQVPSDLTKGTGSDLSAIIFGNLADVVLGMWSGLDILVDPFTGSTSGTVRVVALQDADVAVRHAESFAAMKDAITT